MKNRTKDEIIDEMVDVMPFELNVKIRPYIKEAMDVYLKQELSKFRQHDVSGRSELLRDYFKWHKEQGFVSHKDSDIDEFLTSNCH